jgi:hypothetical protein
MLFIPLPILLPTLPNVFFTDVNPLENAFPNVFLIELNPLENALPIPV